MSIQFNRTALEVAKSQTTQNDSVIKLLEEKVKNYILNLIIHAGAVYNCTHLHTHIIPHMRFFLFELH